MPSLPSASAVCYTYAAAAAAAAHAAQSHTAVDEFGLVTWLATVGIDAFFPPSARPIASLLCGHTHTPAVIPYQCQSVSQSVLCTLL